MYQLRSSCALANRQAVFKSASTLAYRTKISYLSDEALISRQNAYSKWLINYPRYLAKGRSLHRISAVGAAFEQARGLSYWLGRKMCPGRYEI